MRRICRLSIDGRATWVDLETMRSLSTAPWLRPCEQGASIDGIGPDGQGPHPRLPPVEPSKIICVGRNYVAHARELGHDVPSEPLLFVKPPSALIGPDQPIELPPPTMTERVDHEVELAAVIGRRTTRVNASAGAQAVWGYTLAVDVTARDVQRSSKLWTRAKGFDTFCPVGPVVVEGLDPSDLAISAVVAHADGSVEKRQDARTDLMVFDVGTIVSFISHTMTLEPGDLILTGTPEGVGPMVAGDRASFHLEGVGDMHLAVVNRSA